MIRYHFTLQLKRLSRLFRETGLLPILGFLGAPLLLIVVAEIIYMKEDYGPYAVALLGLLFSVDIARSELQFKRSVYGKTISTYISILESLILSLPFLLILIWHKHFLLSSLLLGLSTLAPLSITSISGTPIKTPFYKIPFEFARGFRIYWPLYILLSFILFQAIRVSNFNLGLFTLGACSLSSLFFYSYQEPIQYILNDSRKVNSFLASKLTHALIGNFILSIAFAGILTFFFIEKWHFIIGVFIIGQILLSTMVLAKYSAYPRALQLPQVILIGLAFWLPPAIIVVVPLLLRSAKRSLAQFSKI